MQIVTLIIEWFLSFIVFLFKKCGINGVLILFLIIELPIMCFYYSNTCNNYAYDKIYQLEKIASITPLDKDDIPLKIKEKLDYHQYYYLINIQMNNPYFTDIFYPKLYANSQLEEEIRLNHYNYYSDIPGYTILDLEEYFPAGTTQAVPYIIAIPSSYYNEPELELEIYEALLVLDEDDKEHLKEEGLIIKENVTFNQN